MWFGELLPMAEKMKEGKRILCDNRTDFIFAVDPGTGFVSTAATSSSATLNGTHTFLAVLQKTGLALTDHLGQYDTLVPVQENLWNPAALTQVRQIEKPTITQARQSLDCADHDGSDTSARAITSYLQGGFGAQALAGSLCRDVAGLCNTDDRLQRQELRALCGRTCQCHSMALYNRTGCLTACENEALETLEARAAACQDVAFGNSLVRDVKAFLAGLTDELVAENKLVRKGSRTTFSRRLRKDFSVRSEGNFSLLEGRAFPLAWNVSRWLSGVADFRTNMGFRTPCRIIPFVNAIFDLDVCSDGDLGAVGSLLGLCPEQCAHVGCGDSLTPHPRMAELEAMQAEWLPGKWHLITRRIRCGEDLEIEAPDAEEFALSFETIAWGNGTYTLDMCSEPAFLGEFVTVSDFFSNTTNRGSSPGCHTSAELDPSDSSPEEYLLRIRRDWLNAANATGASLKLICHSDGNLGCGDQVEGSTVGAPNGMRIFGLEVGANAGDMTFDACGSQLDANLSIWRYRPGEPPALVRSPDGPGSCGPSSSRLTVPLSKVEAAYDRLVVAGVGSSQGDFELSARCKVPVLSCGDTVEGDVDQFVLEYKFVPGSATRAVLDTCDSRTNFDTVMYISPKGKGAGWTTFPECDVAAPPCRQDDNNYDDASCMYTSFLDINLNASTYSVAIGGHPEGRNDYDAGHFVLKVSCDSPS